MIDPANVTVHVTATVTRVFKLDVSGYNVKTLTDAGGLNAALRDEAHAFLVDPFGLIDMPEATGTDTITVHVIQPNAVKVIQSVTRDISKPVANEED